MTLRPEQQRALDYARRRGSEATLDSIHQRVAATYEAIESQVAAIGPVVAARRPGPPSAWSVHEVVDHLVESDRRAALQLAELLAGRPVADEIPA
ncbi:MAG TPA: hypothetical protein VNA04_06230, partial [Thermoanaerobaculia bacterium]|nr:hypothetical protein [Thermoanaerobaculia bacterium]